MEQAIQVPQVETVAPLCPVCGSDTGATIGTKSGFQLLLCPDCGIRYVDPMPGAADLAAFYSNYETTPHYIGKTARKITRAKRRLRRYRRMAPGKRFLDLGCSIGTAVDAASRLGFEAFGNDIDPESIRLAREMFPRGRYHAGPVSELPAEWGSFDFVYCAEVIEHLTDPHAYLAAMSARMTPGALLYLTTPDAGHRHVPDKFELWNQVVPPHHLIFFDRPSLTALLAAYGLEVLKVEYCRKPGLKVLARNVGTAAAKGAVPPVWRDRRNLLSILSSRWGTYGK